MTGPQYEYLYALYLKCMGYPQVMVTKGSGDHGVDIIAYKAYKKYAFQCKLYSKTVSYKAIQEVYTGAKVLNCDRATVVTNSTFTKQAIEDSKNSRLLSCPENL